MSGIICAIRGGPASQPTIQKAIRVAAEKQLPIYFLYVVNLDFLNRPGSGHVHTLTTELEQMGEFILLTAQAQAEKAGVEAHAVVRHGQVQNQIIALCLEMEADYVVLGRPSTATSRNLFTSSHMQSFSDRIRAETRTEILFASGETE